MVELREANNQALEWSRDQEGAEEDIL